MTILLIAFGILVYLEEGDFAPCSFSYRDRDTFNFTEVDRCILVRS